ncbi:hypothetical protein GH714_016411 [Hevea brasiliensis]|uniref:Thioredoxin domain-containing protein n=1 Tax=Hevea brasiliensis TaxID=3981 RepID=A0A6A6L0B0_HEVBR|nr:hypothetical protein GH714_016411 [Hevea brasiliensis]
MVGAGTSTGHTMVVEAARERQGPDMAFKLSSELMDAAKRNGIMEMLMVHRVIDEIAGDYDGKLKCFVLNTDSDLQIAENYEIKAVPVVLLFKNGEKRESVVGTMPKEFYVAAIERVLQL